MTQVWHEPARVTQPATMHAAVVTGFGEALVELSSTECLAPAGDIDFSECSPAVASTTTHVRDWIVEVAGKLARREGRNDVARDTEIISWCREAATRFVDAPIQAFVPLLVERIVGDRIRRERNRNGCAAVATDHSGRPQPRQLASS